MTSHPMGLAARAATPALGSGRPRFLHFAVLAVAAATLLAAILIGFFVFNPVRLDGLGSSQASNGMKFPGLFLVGAVLTVLLSAAAQAARERLAALAFALSAGLGLAFAGYATYEMWSVAQRDGVPVSLASHFAPPLKDAPFGIPPRVQRDVVFGQPGGVPLQLDVWPATTPPTGAARPAILRLHSGGWVGGGKGEQPIWNDWLNAQGFVVFDADYRLPPKAGWRDEVGDAKCALAYIAANAARYGVDPQLISVMGRSAGGNLALMAAYSPAAALPSSCPGPAVKVKSVINLYGPSELAGYWRTAPTPGVMQDALRRYVGASPAEAPDRYRQLSPVTHVGPTAPPTISFYGFSDRLVGTDQEMALENALIAADVDHETYLLPGAEHDYDAHWGGLASQYTRDRLQRFLDRYARPSLSR